jgi:hypothetical protein
LGSQCWSFLGEGLGSQCCVGVILGRVLGHSLVLESSKGGSLVTVLCWTHLGEGLGSQCWSHLREGLGVTVLKSFYGGPWVTVLCWRHLREATRL